MQGEGYGVHASVTHGDTKLIFSLDKPKQKDRQDGCEIEFWKLRKVSEEKQSNMILTTVDINVMLPKIGKYAKTVTVTLPVARITRNVNEFDELAMYVTAKEKVNKIETMFVVSTKQEAKKAK
jgi:hypothetical protein